MAEGLIFQRTNTHADPEKDRQGCFKRGFPVVLFQDGHEWGREESLLNWMEEGRHPSDWPNHFYLFRWPNVDAADLRHLFETQKETDSGIILPRHQYHRLRKYRVDLDLLSITYRAQLIARREVEFVGAAGMLAFNLSLRKVADGQPYLTSNDLRKRVA